ncbi:hypothetical protein [Bifidobacterium sp. SO1]|uniref:hypothetical protein n=1 Tax=Bifidobacterium sp. SO1 TaxID=2809029 RepID=UPI001BDCCEA6|nr:hypothetical protein [Bifidobacterium sp. SO1]MBT1162108.1 hypothetical protein [Bifidobacterium sp. SO1]
MSRSSDRYAFDTAVRTALDALNLTLETADPLTRADLLLSAQSQIGAAMKQLVIEGEDQR